MNFLSFIGKIGKKLEGPLPGFPAQMKMASLSRLHHLANLFKSDNAIQSSVLILLYPFRSETGFVLTLRNEYKGIHSGQISLPGGKYEEDDESLVFTALREAKEEIGIDPKQVQILGQLTPLYIPPSKFLVTPVVGFVSSRPEFIADPYEVAKIIEIRISDFLSNGSIRQKKINFKVGFSLNTPCYSIDGNYIWGATAMILSEFREILKTIPVSNPVRE